MPAEFAVADIVIAAVLAVSAVFGLMRGLVKEVAALVIWASAGLLALAFAGPLGEAIGLNLGPRLQKALGFAVIFIVVLIVGAFAQRLLRGLVETTGLSGTDRTLGLLFGAARGVLVVTLTLIVVRPFAEERPWWTESKLAPALLTLEPEVMELAQALMDRFPGEAPAQADPPPELGLPALDEAV